MALVCLALGELYLGQGRPADALPFWRQAYVQYSGLFRRQPANFLLRLNLGDSVLA
jgi:hypothetical protein